MLLNKSILGSKIKSSNYFPWRIILLYLILGGLWILFSDSFVASLTNDPRTLTKIQTYKGWFFILITAVFFFFLIKRDFKLIELTQKELAESEERFRSLFENAPLGYQSIDKDGEIITVNKAACSTLGYCKDELIGKNFQQFLEGESAQKFNKILLQVQIEGQLQDAEFTIRKKDNSLSTVAIEGKVSYSGDCRFKQLHCIIIDVTERKKTEADLRKLSSAVDQNPTAVLIMNKDGIIEYANPKFSQLTGYSHDEAVGKYPDFLKPFSIKNNQHLKIWDKLNQGEAWTGEFYDIRKNGDGIWELSSISPIKNNKNETTHFLIAIEDITQRKIAEKELIDAKKEAQDLSKLKSNLLGNISHELRTPLVGIIGYAEFLKETALDWDQSDMVQKIINSSKRLTNTLNSILYLSQFASRENYLNIEEINLSKHTPFFLSTFIEEAKEKGLGFSINVKSKSASALIDDKMYFMILNNLVENAIKFTRQGKIEVIIEVVEIDAIKYSAIHVSDTGIGIADQDKEKIFQEFRQASEGVSRWYEGTGLGLTLAKKMVEAMNGTIHLESEVGVGSTFTVMFPSVAAKVPVAETERSIHSKQKSSLKNILLVEDNFINKEVTELFLKEIYLIDYAENGETAVQMSKQKYYDAILMDINLGGGINGIETAGEIRKLNGYEDIPIIAITGYAMAGDKEVLLSSGLTHYLAKPFEKHELLSILSEILEEN